MAELPRIRPRVPQHRGWGVDSGRLVSKFLLEAPQVPWTALPCSLFFLLPSLYFKCLMNFKKTSSLDRLRNRNFLLLASTWDVSRGHVGVLRTGLQRATTRPREWHLWDRK